MSLKFSSMDQKEKQQLALTLASLILSDDKSDITAENLAQILKVANIDVPVYLPMIFANALSGKNVTDLACSSSAVAVATTSAAAPETKKEEKKENKKEEEPEVDFDMGDMFG
mgnify:CR=1 FL=1